LVTNLTLNPIIFRKGILNIEPIRARLSGHLVSPRNRTQLLGKIPGAHCDVMINLLACVWRSLIEISDLETELKLWREELLVFSITRSQKWVHRSSCHPWTLGTVDAYGKQVLSVHLVCIHFVIQMFGTANKDYPAVHRPL